MANPKAGQAHSLLLLPLSRSINHPWLQVWATNPHSHDPTSSGRSWAEVKFSEATPPKGQLPTVPLFWFLNHVKNSFSGEIYLDSEFAFFFWVPPLKFTNTNHKEQYHFHWRCYRRVREMSRLHCIFIATIKPLSTTILLKALPWPLDNCELFSVPFLLRAAPAQGLWQRRTEEI